MNNKEPGEVSRLKLDLYSSRFDLCFRFNDLYRQQFNCGAGTFTGVAVRNGEQHLQAGWVSNFAENTVPVIQVGSRHMSDKELAIERMPGLSCLRES
jgi:hypothetical protein